MTAAIIAAVLPSIGWAATITVTSGSTDELGTNSSCSLREAIINANNDAATYADCTAGSGDDTISIPAGTYTLSLGASGENSAAEGDLDIKDDVALSGAGSDSTIIDAGGLTADADGYQDRVFHVVSAVTVTISGVKITGGNAGTHGGGIYTASGSSLLTLTNSVVSDNRAGTSGTINGGGIYAIGSLTLTNATVSGNELNGTAGIGGGIYAAGNLTMTGSAASNNIITASGLGQGAGIYLSSSRTATLTTTTISGNQISGGSSSYGGGFYAARSNTLTVTDGVFSGNSITTTSGTAGGGGLYVGAGGALTITGSTFSENAVTGNSSLGLGGGLQIKGTSTSSVTATITNSTFSGNSATTESGSSSGDGGGLYLIYTTLNLNNVTIAANSATTYNGGISIASSATAVFRNTLLAGNTAGSSGPECNGTFTTAGYNLIQDATDCSGYDATQGDQTGVDPLLDSLADNGGDTQTHALLSGSPAIDTGSCTDISGNTVSTDQRGESRPSSSCDIGAYEVVCGDSDMAGAEACDDGGTSAGDGCSATCTVETDTDGDGSYAEVDDCDDTNSAIHPGATETCGDDVDSDCDTDPDSFVLYADSDGDGYGSSSGATSFNCDESGTQTGYVSTSTDCNDSSSAVNPGAAETCNSIDDDCDGITDEDVTTTYYADSDGDGYGSASSSQAACSQPSGYVTSATDCNDGSSSINPAATDTPDNGADENCDGADDTTAGSDGDGTSDSDGDGVVDSEDAFPDDASESVDTDGDGTGDNADEDDDGDGVTDADDTDDDGDGTPDSGESEGTPPPTSDSGASGCSLVR